MSDCRFGVSPVNYPDPDQLTDISINHTSLTYMYHDILFGVRKNFEIRTLIQFGANNV